MLKQNKFCVTEFKIEKMIAHPCILIIGRNSEDKSQLVHDIIQSFNNSNFYDNNSRAEPTFFAYQLEACDFYKSQYPNADIKTDFDAGTLRHIIAEQTIMCKNKINNNKIVIFDNCLIRYKSWPKDNDLMEIMLNGRHYCMTTIVTLQIPIGITPDIRLNFDYIFLFYDDSTINKKKLWDNYASVFPNLVTFDKVFSACTFDHQCMVIDNRKQTNNICEKIFWIKPNSNLFQKQNECVKDNLLTTINRTNKNDDNNSSEELKQLECWRTNNKNTSGTDSDFDIDQNQSTEKVDINEFNMEGMTDNSNILVIGTRGSGKSILVGDILQTLINKKTSSHLTIFSPTEKINKYYEPKYPMATIKYQYNSDTIKKIIFEQIKAIEEKIDKKEIIVFDNCFCKKDWYSCSEVADILLNSRYYNIVVIIVSQLSLIIPIEYRLNFDYIFQMRDDNEINRKRFWRDYVSFIENYDIFSKKFTEYTRNYRAIVINNGYIYWYKVKYLQCAKNNNISYDSDTDIKLFFCHKSATKEAKNAREKNNTIIDNYFEMKYKDTDNNYEFSFTTNKFDHKTIKILTDHVTDLKRINADRYINSQKNLY